MSFPDLPARGQPQWFDDRDAFDHEVRSRLEALDPNSLIPTIDSRINSKIIVDPTPQQKIDAGEGTIFFYTS